MRGRCYLVDAFFVLILCTPGDSKENLLVLVQEVEVDAVQSSAWVEEGSLV